MKTKAERLRYLLDKAIKTNESLTPEEIKELHGYVAEIDKIMKEKKAKGETEDLSETIERSVNKSMIQFALKRQKQVSFDRLPLSEKFSKLQKELDSLHKSPYMKELLDDKAKQDAEEEFERFYSEYVKKHGGFF